MKLKIMMLLLFIFCVYSIGIVNANTLPLLGKVIYLDPGHGGSDPGALYGNVREADINLQLAFNLQKEFERNGAIVYLTRYGDYDLAVKNAIRRKRSDLSRRANIINDSKADLYFSIHLNADPSPKWSGAQIFYDDVLEENENIAKHFQDYLKKELKTNRNYKKLNDQYMYQRIKVPGILLEAGFLSNDNERYLLKQKNYQKKIANIIVAGTVDYFNG